MGRRGVASITLATASLVLLGTAVLHGSGYGMVTDMLASAGVSPMWAAGLRMLWLDFSIHLVVVALIYLVAAVRLDAIGGVALAWVTLLPTVDTVLLYSTAGVFPGSLLLTLAVLLAWTGVGLVARRWSV